MTKVLALMLIGSGFAACATPGGRPHDMSGAAHDVAAAEAEQQAAAHARQFDPEAEDTRQRCTGGGPRRWQGGAGWNGQGGAGALGVGSGWNDSGGCGPCPPRARPRRWG